VRANQPISEPAVIKHYSYSYDQARYDVPRVYELNRAGGIRKRKEVGAYSAPPGKPGSLIVYAPNSLVTYVVTHEGKTVPSPDPEYFKWTKADGFVPCQQDGKPV